MRGSAIIDDLEARGLLHDSTDLDALRTRLDERPITVYAGFDPSADSLHAGNLVPLVLLRRFQEAGHRPIVLAGGATGMIGDPSGRSDERNLLDDDTIDHNLASIIPQLEQLLDFSPGPLQAQQVDNRTWTAPLTMLEFLRDVGKHVTVNQMLAKESVKSRVRGDGGISYTEFSYMLLQANDFWWLNVNEGCELQVGGSDQWGNITAGIDLVRRREGTHLHGLSVPLLLRSDGVKFGKTADGAVWLGPEKTSPYAFYQYWFNTVDADVEPFLLRMTLVPVDEIRALVAAHGAAPEKREGQRRLAWEVTALVHGARAADEALTASQGFTSAASEASAEQLAGLADEIPTTRLTRDELPIDLVDLLVTAELEKSKSAARRQIHGGGISVNDVKVGETRLVQEAELLHGRYLLLRRGKRQRHLVVVS